MTFWAALTIKIYIMFNELYIQTGPSCNILQDKTFDYLYGKK